MTALDIVRAFEGAWTRDKDFEKARGFLADDFKFDAPTGKNDTADEFIEGLKQFAQVVTGPFREIAAFGDENTALMMFEIPTSAFGMQRDAAYYEVRDGRIQSETLVFDATAVNAAMAQRG
jgi:hypothetical protein